MSNIAIPNLPAVTSLNGTELVLGVQSNTSVKITTQQIANFTATSSNNYVNTLSFGTTGLTPAGVVGGNITVAGTLNVANGGTGVTTFGATNTLLYTTSANNISSIAAGTVDQILAVNSSGVPYWRSTIPATAGVDSISFGTTGLTPSTNTSGIVTVSGTLAIGSGGTGITSFGTGVQTALGQNVTGSGGIVLATAPTIANPVITGGSINNTPIGATTASTGAFSYLSTNSSTSTTPVLSFNASNSPIAAGASISGSYLQFVLQNKSATAGASTNYVLSNDSGTDSAFYGEFGMNSSVYSASTPGDFFSINNGVYFSAHDGDVSIGSGNGYKVYFPWGGSATSAHVINASGALGFSTNLGTTPALSGTTGFGTSGQALITGGSAAAPAWGTLGVSGGGTGQSAALTQYGIVYGASTTAMGITAAGTTGQVLLANTGGAPTWGTVPAAGVTSISFGTTGLTPSSATTGAIVVAGTLGAASGGTGQSSYTVGDILYASTTTALSKLADVATGSVLVSGGVGAAPAYSATPTLTSLTSPSIYGGTGTGSLLTLQSTTGVGATDSILMKVGNNGATTALSIATTGIVSLPTTGALVLPASTTGNRPTASTGMLRFNTTTVAFEGYNGTSWASVGGGATGGSTDQIFYLNGQTVTADYSIPSSYNAGTFGPITVNGGVTVTIPSGSTWSIV
jgi:hypothetical protein